MSGPAFRPRRGSALRPFDDQQAVAVIVRLFGTLQADTQAKVAAALKTAASLANGRVRASDQFPVADAATVAGRAVPEPSNIPVPEANFAVAPGPRERAQAQEKAHARPMEPTRHAADVANADRAGIGRGRAAAASATAAAGECGLPIEDRMD